MDYYDEIAQEAKALMDKEQWEEAFRLLDIELRMPYIPKASETILVEYYNKCRHELNATQVKNHTLEELETLLIGSLEEQFQAVELLRNANIRNHLKEVEVALQGNLHYLAKSYIVEILIEQEIHEELTMIHEGLEVSFIPAFVELPMESDGAIMVVDQLKDWLENDDPSFLAMCVESFIKEAYLRLPFNVEEDEAFALAVAIVDYVYRAYADETGFQNFCDAHDILSNGSYALLLDQHEI